MNELEHVDETPVPPPPAGTAAGTPPVATATRLTDAVAALTSELASLRAATVAGPGPAPPPRQWPLGLWATIVVLLVWVAASIALGVCVWNVLSPSGEDESRMIVTAARLAFVAGVELMWTGGSLAAGAELVRWSSPPPPAPPRTPAPPGVEPHSAGAAVDAVRTGIETLPKLHIGGQLVLLGVGAIAVAAGLLTVTWVWVEGAVS